MPKEGQNSKSGNDMVDSLDKYNKSLDKKNEQGGSSKTETFLKLFLVGALLGGLPFVAGLLALCVAGALIKFGYDKLTSKNPQDLNKQATQVAKEATKGENQEELEKCEDLSKGCKDLNQYADVIQEKVTEFSKTDIGKKYLNNPIVGKICEKMTGFTPNKLVDICQNKQLGKMANIPEVGKEKEGNRFTPENNSFFMGEEPSNINKIVDEPLEEGSSKTRDESPTIENDGDLESAPIEKEKPSVDKPSLSETHIDIGGDSKDLGVAGGIAKGAAEAVKGVADVAKETAKTVSNGAKDVENSSKNQENNDQKNDNKSSDKKDSKKKDEKEEKDLITGEKIEQMFKIFVIGAFLMGIPFTIGMFALGLATIGIGKAIYNKMNSPEGLFGKAADAVKNNDPGKTPGLEEGIDKLKKNVLGKGGTPIDFETFKNNVAEEADKFAKTPEGQELLNNKKFQDLYTKSFEKGGVEKLQELKDEKIIDDSKELEDSDYRLFKDDDASELENSDYRLFKDDDISNEKSDVVDINAYDGNSIKEESKALDDSSFSLFNNDYHGAQPENGEGTVEPFEVPEDEFDREVATKDDILAEQKQIELEKQQDLSINSIENDSFDMDMQQGA